ncbi:hypothetical protein AGMMS49960_00010 [Betaproteobacteria bacterium]|nr:hypothetical protein AGMMS49543_28670 [Betaproteobacteria bacterium]GHT97933.1 hypothetical protein AGMMS49960_00010 [Betaproteobacteria bacterium]GHU25440.1 hypothetical protein AGMMS50243_29250 [Betaproteobacteria bacterium]
MESALYNNHGPEVVAALKLMPLVFVRKSELRIARWKDIDLEAAKWTYFITKTRTDHHVPLSRQAVEILNELALITRPIGEPGNALVFPGRNEGCPFSEDMLNKGLRELGYGNEIMTVHGFRASARTMLAENLEYPAEIIEHQLAHAVRDSNGEAYNRTKFLCQRKEMMQAWADYLDKLKANAGEQVA